MSVVAQMRMEIAARKQRLAEITMETSRRVKEIKQLLAAAAVQTPDQLMLPRVAEIAAELVILQTEYIRAQSDIAALEKEIGD
jgi:hypothetical protein